MSAMEDGQRVKSWLGSRGTVVHQTMMGYRKPRPMVRFDGRLTYHRPWAQWFVREVEAER